MAGVGPLRIELGWPAKELSPNARVHPMVYHRYKKAAKNESGWATKIALGCNRNWAPQAETVNVHLIAHPPANWNTGDKDNFVARVKPHIDGIAKVLGVNDRIFEAPTVTWADKIERGALVIELS